MYKVTISPRAKLRLKKIKETYENVVAEAIQELKENPFVGKPLEEDLSGKYSYRVGEYRIIYRINDQNKKVQIITAGHRSTIYN